MAVYRPHRLVRVGDTLSQSFERVANHLWHTIAHGIGKINGGRALINHALEYATQKIEIRAATVLRTELDIIGKFPRVAHCQTRLLVHLIR